MRLGLFDVSRRWPRQRTRGNDGTSFREPWNFSLSSVQFVGLILPSNCNAETWPRLHAPAISSDIWPSGCVTSVVFGMACLIVIERGITVMQFTGHSLPVHHFVTARWYFLPCLILSAKLYFTILLVAQNYIFPTKNWIYQEIIQQK